MLPGYEPTEMQKLLPGQLIPASDPVGTLGFGLGCNVHGALALTSATDDTYTSATTSAAAVRLRPGCLWIGEFYR